MYLLIVWRVDTKFPYPPPPEGMSRSNNMWYTLIMRFTHKYFGRIKHDLRRRERIKHHRNRCRISAALTPSPSIDSSNTIYSANYFLPTHSLAFIVKHTHTNVVMVVSPQLFLFNRVSSTTFFNISSVIINVNSETVEIRRKSIRSQTCYEMLATRKAVELVVWSLIIVQGLKHTNSRLILTNHTLQNSI